MLIKSLECFQSRTHRLIGREICSCPSFPVRPKTKIQLVNNKEAFILTNLLLQCTYRWSNMLIKKIMAVQK